MATDRSGNDALVLPYLTFGVEDVNNTAKIEIKGKPFLAIRLPFTPQSTDPRHEKFEANTDRYGVNGHLHFRAHHIIRTPQGASHYTNMTVVNGRSPSEADRKLVRDNFTDVQKQLAVRLGETPSIDFAYTNPAPHSCPIARAHNRIFAIVPLKNTAGD